MSSQLELFSPDPPPRKRGGSKRRFTPAETKEHAKANVKAWRAKNKDKVTAYMRAYSARYNGYEVVIRRVCLLLEQRAADRAGKLDAKVRKLATVRRHKNRIDEDQLVPGQVLGEFEARCGLEAYSEGASGAHIYKSGFWYLEMGCEMKRGRNTSG